MKVCTLPLLLFLDLVGYVMAVYPTRRSATQSLDEYFDMDIQCGEDKMQQFLVMVFMDYPVTHKNHFTEVSQPLKLKNIATAQSGTKFLNRASNVESSTPQKFQFLKREINKHETKTSGKIYCKDGSM